MRYLDFADIYDIGRLYQSKGHLIHGLASKLTGLQSNMPWKLFRMQEQCWVC